MASVGLYFVSRLTTSTLNLPATPPASLTFFQYRSLPAVIGSPAPLAGPDWSVRVPILIVFPSKPMPVLEAASAAVPGELPPPPALLLSLLPHAPRPASANTAKTAAVRSLRWFLMFPSLSQRSVGPETALLETRLNRRRATT